MGEELKAKIDALPEAERPKSDVKRRAFAEAHYANVAADRENQSGEGGGCPTTPCRTVAAPTGGSTTTTAIREGPTEAALVAAALAEEEALEQKLCQPSCGALDQPARQPSSRTRSGTRARKCMDGLDWQVDIPEGEKEMVVTVTFDDQVWEALQGSGTQSFGEAVDFELAEQELRVLHVGASVLELALPKPVNPAAAATKISNRKRRVIIRAPLR